MEQKQAAISVLVTILIAFLAMSIAFFIYGDPILMWLDVQNSFLLYLLVQIIEIVIIPIPGDVIMLSIAAANEATRSFLLIYIGNLLGASASFFIARFIGDKYVHYLITPKQFERARKLIEKYKITLPLMYSIPIFPFDVLNVVAGMFGLSQRFFLLSISVGFVSTALIYTIVGTVFREAVMQWFSWIAGISFLIIGYFMVMYVIDSAKSKRSKK